MLGTSEPQQLLMFSRSEIHQTLRLFVSMSPRSGLTRIREQCCVSNQLGRSTDSSWADADSKALAKTRRADEASCGPSIRPLFSRLRSSFSQSPHARLRRREGLRFQKQSRLRQIDLLG